MQNKDIIILTISIIAIIFSVIAIILTISYNSRLSSQVNWNTNNSRLAFDTATSAIQGKDFGIFVNNLTIYQDCINSATEDAVTCLANKIKRENNTCQVNLLNEVNKCNGPYASRFYF